MYDKWTREKFHRLYCNIVRNNYLGLCRLPYKKRMSSKHLLSYALLLSLNHVELWPMKAFLIVWKFKLWFASYTENRKLSPTDGTWFRLISKSNWQNSPALQRYTWNSRKKLDFSRTCYRSNGTAFVWFVCNVSRMFCF